MAVKKTIAIIGAAGIEGTAIANQLAFSHYRLLLIAPDAEQVSSLSKTISEINLAAETDTIECVKDGCWEADIIILAVPSQEEKNIAEMIKEVATQKIVVSIWDNNINGGQLQRILPYSKLVKLGNIFNLKEKSIAGNDKAANKEIADIFSNASLSINME